MSAPAHRVLRMWVRTAMDGPLEERDTLELVAGEGVVGDHGRGGKRHVTLVFQDDWDEAGAALGRSVDPAGRRANVLLSGGGGAARIGTRVRLGTAELEIVGETAPCPVMERAAPGLMDALKPNVRAGVWARILRGTTLQRGDELQ
mgnify:CR=1 FL=1